MAEKTDSKRDRKIKELEKNRELQKELKQKEKSLAEAAALLVLKKTGFSYKGLRGRLILKSRTIANGNGKYNKNKILWQVWFNFD